MDDKLVNGTLSDGGEAGAPSAPRRDSRRKRRWATALVVALTGLAVCLGVDLVLFASSAKDLAVEPVDLETWLDKEDGTVSIRVAFALAAVNRTRALWLLHSCTSKRVSVLFPMPPSPDRNESRWRSLA